MFDIRPTVVLSEGLVVLRVEYVVVEVVSPSDLRPLPTHSDGVTSSPLLNQLYVSACTGRSCASMCMYYYGGEFEPLRIIALER